MPLSPQLFGSNIRSAATMSGLSGSEMPRVCNAIGDGICKALLGPGILTVQLVGVAGPGVVSGAGPVLVVGKALASDILAGMTSVGHTGASRAQLANAIAGGVSDTMLAAAITGTSPIVSSGGGTAMLTPTFSPSYVYSFLMAAASMYGLSGSEVARVMDGISRGVSAHFLKSVKPPVLSVGPPVPPPPVGPIPAAGPAILNFV